MSRQVADPSVVANLTTEFVKSGMRPLLINNISYFVKSVPGKPGKTITFRVSLFSFDHNHIGYYLENNKGKCALLEIFVASTKDKKAGMSFQMYDKDLVFRECSYYSSKEYINQAMTDAKNKLVKKLEELRS